MSRSRIGSLPFFAFASTCLLLASDTTHYDRHPHTGETYAHDRTVKCLEETWDMPFDVPAGSVGRVNQLKLTGFNL